MSVRKNRLIRGVVVFFAGMVMALAFSAPATAEPVGQSGEPGSSVTPLADFCRLNAYRPAKFGNVVSSYGTQYCEGAYLSQKITVELLRWNGLWWTTRDSCTDGWSGNSTVGCPTPGTGCTGSTEWKTKSIGEARHGAIKKIVYSPEVHFDC